ncbi:MAG: Bax inhibitor-1 family protein, partial [Rhodospirillales bacterium]|nr:Bax inhibitor-1 family protein [Rhodospirillales bacterium]
MAFSPDYRTYRGAPGTAAASAAVDAGLRSYMLRVYNWMTSGLLLTGIVAYGIAHTGLIELFYHQVVTPRGVAVQPTGLAILAMLAPLAFVLALSVGVNRLSKTAVQTIFWLFAATMGA